MQPLVQQLAFYGAYHRDRRNVATHFFGIPMIMVAIAAALARLGEGGLSAALVAAVLALVYYLRLRPLAALVMAPILAVVVGVGTILAVLPLEQWLAAWLGLFVVGWIFQAVGHVFEGRKPAFFDDLRGLLVGPLFLVMETGFALGLGRDLHNQVRTSLAALP